MRVLFYLVFLVSFSQAFECVDQQILQKLKAALKQNILLERTARFEAQLKTLNENTRKQIESEIDKELANVEFRDIKWLVEIEETGAKFCSARLFDESGRYPILYAEMGIEGIYAITEGMVMILTGFGQDIDGVF